MYNLKTNFTPLFDYVAWKAIFALVVAGVTSFFTNDYVVYFLYFVALVVLDVFTKHLSISANHIAKLKGIDKTKIPFSKKFYGIYLASNDGVITSLMMRDKITTKLYTYLLVIAAAVLTDSLCCGVQGGDGFILYKLSVAYLGATEFMSILENLRDGGNNVAKKLLEIVKKKVDKL